MLKPLGHPYVDSDNFVCRQLATTKNTGNTGLLVRSSLAGFSQQIRSCIVQVLPGEIALVPKEKSSLGHFVHCSQTNVEVCLLFSGVFKMISRVSFPHGGSLPDWETAVSGSLKIPRFPSGLNHLSAL